jgi:NADPH2:quinone reductase
MTISALVAAEGSLVERVEVAAPEPAADQALVAVETFSVNRGELNLLASGRENWRPGQDVAGTIRRAAADGSGPPQGARVVAHPDQGGWATEVAVPTTAIAELPDNVDAAPASTLGVAGLTALRLVRDAPDLAAKRLLVTGASGGLGHFLVELAALRGAEITAVSRTPERGRRLLDLGASKVVAAVEEAEGPFDVVIDSVGGEVLGAAAERTAMGGTLFWVGRAAGDASTLSFGAIAGPATYMRIIPWSYWRTGASDAADLAALVRLVAAGHLHPEVGRLEDWAESGAVLAALRDREVVGNAVLQIS